MADGGNQRSGSSTLFENARQAVKHGDVAFIQGYVRSVAGAVTSEGRDGKTLLHCAAMSGQTNVIAELLAAGADPYARCSSGETPLDLAGRNGHNDALSRLLCHPSPMAAATGATQAVLSSSTASATSPQGPMVSPASAAATPKSTGKGGLSLFRKTSWRRKLPKGANGTAVKTPRKGRGKRPGTTGGGDGEHGGTSRNVPGASDGGIDVGGGWIMYTDAEGFQYCWNEALQESRWVDETANLPAPGPSPAASCISPEQPWDRSRANTSEIYGSSLASPVHSPGWPSPRGAGGGFMQLPLSGGQAASYHGAAGPVIAMPPTPPVLSRSSGHGGGGGGGLETQARASGEAVGVAWLGVAEKAAAAPSATQKGGAAAAASAGGGAGAIANTAFYGQDRPPSPTTKGKLWAERGKAAGEDASKIEKQDSTPAAAKRRAWMKNFRRNPDTKGKSRSSGGKSVSNSGAAGSSSGGESGNDADDISALTEVVGEGGERSGSSRGSDSSTSSSGSSSTSSSSSSGSSSITRGDSSDSSDTDSSESSNSTRSIDDSGTVPGVRTPSPTAASESAGALTPPETAGAGSLPVAVAAPSDLLGWSEQPPTVVAVPAVGVPAGYAPPTDAAYSGQPSGYAGVGSGAAYGGWADLEPQLHAQPPYAPTALWRQARAPAGYGVIAQQGSDGTYGSVGFEQQDQPHPTEGDHLIRLSSSPPSNR
eukprot:g13916.t1